MLISIIIYAFLSGFLQTDYSYLSTVEVSGDLHFSDPIGNVYVVNENDLKKFDPQNLHTANYKNVFLGNIHSVDISDPLRILLYYRDHNQIVWVDNFLSEIRSPVFLDALGIDQAELVCSSNQGGFWVLNGLNNQLQYFNTQLQFVHESMSLNELTGPDIKPVHMVEKSRSLYLNVPGTGVLVFDRFGNYARTLAVDVPVSFQVTDQNLYYFKDGDLFSYHLMTAETTLLELPAKGDFIHAELQPDFLYLFTKKDYLVYKISR